jgi:PKD repeat protein
MKKLFFSLSALLCGVLMNAQTVTTYAGKQYSGTGNYTGIRSNHKDSVYFSAPMGIEVDTAGRLYVSNEHNIFWIQDNTAYLAAGYTLDPESPGASDSKDFAGSQARFSRPAGLAINPSTNELMVADLNNHQIRKVERFINTATQQIVSTLAGVKSFNGGYGDGSNASAKFNGPIGIAVAPNGDVYVADRTNHCIRKISGGMVTTIAGSAGNAGHTNGTGTAAKFTVPFNVFLDGNDLLVSDYGNGAIRKINLTTLAVTDLITTGLFGPKDLCKVGSILYIADGLCVKRYEGNVLSLYAGSTSQQGFVDGEGPDARFSDISGIVFHPKSGLLYVCDLGNNTIRSISPNARPEADFTTSTTTATIGQTVVLTNTSINYPDEFRWKITPSSYNLLNNTSLTDSIVYLSFSQTGTFSIQLYVSNQSGADSILKSNLIAVSSVTAVPVVAFSANNTQPMVNETISLIDMTANTPTSWRWRITPATFLWMNGTDSTNQIPNVKFSNGDNYTITLVASNAQGTKSLTKVDYIKVNSTSVASLNHQSIFKAFPNPAHSYINIQAFTEGQVELWDMYGRRMETLEANSDLNRIDISAYKKGTYFIKFISNQGIYSSKVVINH